jgi:LysM repeat protein
MKKLLPTLPRRSIGLVLLLATLFSTPIGYGLAEGTMVVIAPSSREIGVGDTTTVDIRIEDVSNLYGAEVHLDFDPALVEVVDADPDKTGVQIEPGTFPSPHFTAQNIVDQAYGKIHFATSQGPGEEPVSGSGILAKITFRGKAGGTSAISFDSVILADRDGGAISTGTQSGSITVIGDTPTPTHTPTPGPTPTHTPTPSVTPTPPPGVLGHHIVRSGEWLYCIGRAYGVDPDAIATQNRILNPNVIQPGKKLKIPNVPRTLPPGRVCPRQFDGGTPPPACRWYHTVAPGENLYRIALRYDVSMWAIAEANHIFNLHYIRAGQVLCIP